MEVEREEKLRGGKKVEEGIEEKLRRGGSGRRDRGEAEERRKWKEGWWIS